MGFPVRRLELALATAPIMIEFSIPNTFIPGADKWFTKITSPYQLTNFDMRSDNIFDRPIFRRCKT